MNKEDNEYMYDSNIDEYEYEYEYDDNYRYCEVCGSKLYHYIETREFWGFPCYEEFWECPKCDN